MRKYDTDDPFVVLDACSTRCSTDGAGLSSKIDLITPVIATTCHYFQVGHCCSLYHPLLDKTNDAPLPLLVLAMKTCQQRGWKLPGEHHFFMSSIHSRISSAIESPHQVL